MSRNSRLETAGQKIGLLFDVDETIITTELALDGLDVALAPHARAYAQQCRIGHEPRYGAEANMLLYPAGFKVVFDFLISQEIPFGIVTAGALTQQGFQEYLKAIDVSGHDQVFHRARQGNKKRAVEEFTQQHTLNPANVVLVDNSPKHCEEAHGAGAQSILAATTYAAVVSEGAQVVKPGENTPVFFQNIVQFLEVAGYDVSNLNTGLLDAFTALPGVLCQKKRRFFNCKPTKDNVLANMSYQLACTSTKLQPIGEHPEVTPARIYQSKIAGSRERDLFNILVARYSREDSFVERARVLLQNCLESLATGFEDQKKLVPESYALLSRLKDSGGGVESLTVPVIERLLRELNSAIKGATHVNGPKAERKKVLRTCLLFVRMIVLSRLSANSSLGEKMKAASQKYSSTFQEKGCHSFASVLLEPEALGLSSKEAVRGSQFRVRSLIAFPPGSESCRPGVYARSPIADNPPSNVWPVFAIYDCARDDTFEAVLSSMFYGANDAYHFDKGAEQAITKAGRIYSLKGSSVLNKPRDYMVDLTPVVGIRKGVQLSIPAMLMREHDKDKPVRRSNHGAVHAMRKFVYVERLLHAIVKEGEASYEQKARGILGDEVLFNLVRLASAADRLGRVIDSEAGGRYPWRSGDIFEQYAYKYVKALPRAQQTKYLKEIGNLKWAMIEPYKGRSLSPPDNAEIPFYNALLMYSHKLDLSRCMAVNVRILNTELVQLKIFSPEKLVAHTKQFMGFAKQLIRETNRISQQRDCIGNNPLVVLARFRKRFGEASGSAQCASSVGVFSEAALQAGVEEWGKNKADDGYGPASSN